MRRLYGSLSSSSRNTGAGTAAASAISLSNFLARRRRMALVMRAMMNTSPMSPTTENTPATAPLFAKNL